MNHNQKINAVAITQGFNNACSNFNNLLSQNSNKTFNHIREKINLDLNE
ncbi:hypothetical protein H1P_1180018 [Hyella patelloides LEGE 07179]|uniref:Uncharacterized protein n=1 Tax=Hyella patelloides LEGE 07179 TaxID=945734 RepID=A0A563VK96_9CYAN|nr:hypothetical protein H1P_1180018 [Hyella patelloides LEGE 07179]